MAAVFLVVSACRFVGRGNRDRENGQPFALEPVAAFLLAYLALEKTTKSESDVDKTDETTSYNKPEASVMFHEPSPTSPRAMITGATPVIPVELDPEHLRQPDSSGSDEIPISGIPRTFQPEDALTATCIVESEDTDDESSLVLPRGRG